ncbi:MAG: hypothetical protein L7H04_07470 [Vulcanisaeta sp.]|jgi:hypothetical protein|nr:hypothetical protein [Vulcanisaeta sp.]MCG2866568.1 hypothetical protein [Vulcanisaeta sp.]
MARFRGLVTVASGDKYIVEFLDSIRLRIVRVTLFTSYQRRSYHEEVYLAIRGRGPDKACITMINRETNLLNCVREDIIPILF